MKEKKRVKIRHLVAVFLVFSGIGAVSGLHISGIDFFNPDDNIPYKAEKEYNVVLISVDALRADHLPCYGYHRNTAPNICSLANRSTLYESAYTQAPWSLPSYASLFTGVYPHQHTANQVDRNLTERFTTLAELLDQHGYTTAAFYDHGQLTPNWGVDQGFDIYRNIAPSPEEIGNSGNISREGREFLINREKPFFLFLHTMDVHFPYQPHNISLRDRWDPEYNGTVNMTDDKPIDIRIYRQNVSREDIERIRANYDAAIHHTDEQLGDIFKTLQDEGLWNDTIIIVTSDHGEVLGEYNKDFGHANYLAEETIHVPLIIKYPKNEKRDILPPVQLIDILSTTITVLGLDDAPVNQSIQGETLPPIGSSPTSFAYSSTIGLFGDIDKKALVRGDMKLIWDRLNGSKYLYNLSNSGESVNLVDRYPNTVNNMEDDIRTIMISSPDSGKGRRSTNITRRLYENLANLGYVQ